MGKWIDFFHRAFAVVVALTCGSLSSVSFTAIETTLNGERENPGSCPEVMWGQLFAQISPEDSALFLMKAIYEKDSLAIHLFSEHASLPQVERASFQKGDFQVGRAFGPLCSVLLEEGYVDDAFRLAQRLLRDRSLVLLNTYLLSLLIDRGQTEQLFKSLDYIREAGGSCHSISLLAHCIETSRFETGLSLHRYFTAGIDKETNGELDEVYALPETVVLLAKTGHSDEILSGLEKAFRYRQMDIEYESERGLDGYKERACVNLFDANCFEEALALWETVEESDLSMENDPDSLELAEEVNVAYCKALVRKGLIEEALSVFEGLRSFYSRIDAGSDCLSSLLRLERRDQAQRHLESFDCEDREEILRKTVWILLNEGCEKEAFSLMEAIEDYRDDYVLPKACSILAGKGKLERAYELCGLIEDEKEREEILDTIMDEVFSFPSLVNLQLLTNISPQHRLARVCADSLRFIRGEFSTISEEWMSLNVSEEKRERITELCGSFQLYRRIEREKEI